MICSAGSLCPALASASFMLGGACALAATPSLPIRIDDFREIQEHLIQPKPQVTTPWKDGTVDAAYPSWTFELTVDESGAVLAPSLKWGFNDLREEAYHAARSVRFKPFVRDGQPVKARVDFTIESRAEDYIGPADRRFPENPDPATVLIVLKRTSCYGTCPQYRVELRGDGQVTYRGEYYVLVSGEHQWRVDPATIAPLLEMFRQADYFALKGYYMSNISDIPTYVTRLSIGDQHKFVLDYGGRLGEAVASTDMGGEDPRMPAVVTEIEKAIDRISGVKTYVSGDESTMQKLRDAHWNFRAKDAGLGLQRLLSKCNVDLAREFILAGAPVNVTGEGMDFGLPVEDAARCGDVELVRLMEKRGALKSENDARAFLWTSVANGYPDMVALALKHYRYVNIRGSEGDTLLASAAGAYADDDPDLAAKFDSAKVIDMLIAAGANPNVRDADGATPLFDASTPAEVNALIRGGADPKVRNKAGETPLFMRYFDEAKAALIAAGTDVRARDKSGATALFVQERASGIKLLLDAGADVNAADNSGRTAIERMNSEEATAALLAAGAKLPEDPARLVTMILEAKKRKWDGVLPQLTAAATSN